MYRGLSPTIIALLPNWAVSTTFLSGTLFLLVNPVIKEITCPTFSWRYVMFVIDIHPFLDIFSSFL